MSTANSMAQQLADVNRLNDNGLVLMKAMYEAITTDKSNATASIELNDGSIQNIIIPSNIFLKSEVERMRATLNNMLGLGSTRSGSIVSINDGDVTKLRQISLSTFKKAIDKLETNEISIDKNININQNPLIEKLLSPLTTIPVKLPNRFNNEKNIVTTKLFVNSLDNLTDGMSYAQVNQYLATNGIGYTTKEDIIKLNPTKQRFYGNFTVFTVTNNENDTFTLRLDKKTYNDTLNVVENSRELEVGNQLITKDGLGLFLVTSVVDNGLGVFVTVKNVSGESGLKAEISALQFYDTTVSDKKVDVVIKGQDKFVLFLSSLDDKTDTQGAYSSAIIVDSSTYKVITNGVETPFNTYFASNILGLGQHLESIVKDNTVPRDLAAKIEKPIVDEQYFKVSQINKHITNTADSKKLKKFSVEKNRLLSDITKLNNSVQKLTTRINKGQYKSRDEKASDESALNTLSQQKKGKQSAYNSTVESIAQLSTFLSAPKSSPKYKVQGFWAIQEPTSSITGDKQRIVQYNVRYKYVPSNSDVSETSSINVDGKEGLISSWNENNTIPLKKTFDNDKQKFIWDSVNISDADINNINQVEISISYGESVIVQVQAIGEAGYPSNPILSEWSEPIKVDFPEELAQDEQIKSIVENNENDLVKVEVDREFETRGVTKLLAKSYTEQDRFFALTADTVASGQFTTEQKTISMAELFKTMQLEIEKLSDIVNRRNTSYSIELVAPNGRVYPVNKLSTVKLFAGHYSESVDINNTSNYGSVVEVVFYLRLINNNATTADITSISSGLLTSPTSNANYENVPLALVGSNDKVTQQNGQLVYLRNKDVSGSNDLVYANNSVSETILPIADITPTTTDAEKTIVQYDGSTFTTVKFNVAASGTDYVVMSTSHPLYIAYINDQTNPTISNALVAEFERIAQFNDSLLENYKQQDLDSLDFTQFTDNDKYLLGRNSTGSKLFMRVSDIQNIQVKTSDSSSSVTLQNGQENALLIPIVYQYRMTDINGRINGDSSLSKSASNVEYVKKLGIDLIVGNELFKFDVEVSSKFRQTTLSASNSANNTVINAIDTQSSNTPNIL